MIWVWVTPRLSWCRAELEMGFWKHLMSELFENLSALMSPVIIMCSNAWRWFCKELKNSNACLLIKSLFFINKIITRMYQAKNVRGSNCYPRMRIYLVFIHDTVRLYKRIVRLYYFASNGHSQRYALRSLKFWSCVLILLNFRY